MQDSQVVRPPKDRPASPSKSASQWLRDHRPGWASDRQSTLQRDWSR